MSYIVPTPGSHFDAEYIRAYFREVDTMRPDSLAEWYAQTGSFRFANSDPVVGRAAIVETLNAFYATVSSMHHQELGLWVDTDSGVFEAEVTFKTNDGRTVRIPAVSILRVENGLVKDFRFVMDARPLALPA
jgi:SnoaL-like domain